MGSNKELSFPNRAGIRMRVTLGKIAQTIGGRIYIYDTVTINNGVALFEEEIMKGNNGSG